MRLDVEQLPSVAFKPDSRGAEYTSDAGSKIWKQEVLAIHLPSLSLFMVETGERPSLPHPHLYRSRRHKIRRDSSALKPALVDALILRGAVGPMG